MQTNTPWEVVIDEEGRDCVKAGEYWIAECIGSPGPHNETSAANAEFIVRACNSHEALVKALQNMLKEFNEGTIPGMVHDGFMACVNAREALKLAGEE